jgi:uncharacterized protein GlcG (DUF336 family)
MSSSTMTQISVTTILLADAQRAIKAGQAKAMEIGVPMSIAVLDGGT